MIEAKQRLIFFILLMFYFSMHSKASVSSKQVKHAHLHQLCLGLLRPSQTINVCDGPLCGPGLLPGQFLATFKTIVNGLKKT